MLDGGVYKTHLLKKIHVEVIANTRYEIFRK